MSKLAHIRRKKGFTQERLAAVSGVPRVTIARAEAGTVSPSLKTLTKLSDALECSIDELVERTA